jgi:hypothetical protein
MSQTVPLEPVPRTRSRLASDRSAHLLATIDAANPLPRKEVDDSDGRAGILIQRKFWRNADCGIGTRVWEAGPKHVAEGSTPFVTTTRTRKPKQDTMYSVCHKS